MIANKMSGCAGELSTDALRKHSISHGCHGQRAEVSGGGCFEDGLPNALLASVIWQSGIIPVHGDALDADGATASGLAEANDGQRLIFAYQGAQHAHGAAIFTGQHMASDAPSANVLAMQS